MRRRCLAALEPRPRAEERELTSFFPSPTEVSQKEVCFMELYEASQVSSLSYTKETLVKDGASASFFAPFPAAFADLERFRPLAEFSRSVYLTDGYKKDETEQEWYYKVRRRLVTSSPSSSLRRRLG